MTTIYTFKHYRNQTSVTSRAYYHDLYYSSADNAMTRLLDTMSDVLFTQEDGTVTDSNGCEVYTPGDLSVEVYGERYSIEAIEIPETINDREFWNAFSARAKNHASDDTEAIREEVLSTLSVLD